MIEPAAESNQRYFLPAIFFIGISIRLLWQVQIHGSLTEFVGSGEAARVALALAQGRGFADSFYPGYGPTAHLLPLNPAIASFWLWMFGPETAAANLCLMAFSLAQVGFAYWLLMRLFQRLDLDAAAVRWSVILLCTVPVFVESEVIAFRYWEGASAVFLMSGSLLLLVEFNTRRRISNRDLALAAVLCALTAFISPPVGLGVITCWGIFALRRLALRQIMLLVLAGAAALGTLVVPWAFRNDQALGSPVWLRSNAGLELAIANHPAAVSGKAPAKVFSARFAEIHPFEGIAARAALRSAGGEVMYSRRLGVTTRSWIVAHPFEFAILALRHLRQFYFPESWQFSLSETDGRTTGRAIWIGLINLAGILALAAGLLHRRKGYPMIALCLVCISAPYMWVQPTPRYTYLVYAPLLFLAIDGVIRGWRSAIGSRNWTLKGRDNESAFRAWRLNATVCLGQMRKKDRDVQNGPGQVTHAQLRRP